MKVPAGRPSAQAWTVALKEGPAGQEVRRESKGQRGLGTPCSHPVSHPRRTRTRNGGLAHAPCLYITSQSTSRLAGSIVSTSQSGQNKFPAVSKTLGQTALALHTRRSRKSLVSSSLLYNKPQAHEIAPGRSLSKAAQATRCSDTNSEGGTCKWPVSCPVSSSTQSSRD